MVWTTCTILHNRGISNPCSENIFYSIFLALALVVLLQSLIRLENSTWMSSSRDPSGSVGVLIVQRRYLDTISHTAVSSNLFYRYFLECKIFHFVTLKGALIFFSRVKLMVSYIFRSMYSSNCSENEKFQIAQPASEYYNLEGLDPWTAYLVWSH